MIIWMFLLVCAALASGVAGFGTLAAGFEIVLAVTAVLAVIGWATAGVAATDRDQRSPSSARPRRVAT